MTTRDSHGRFRSRRRVARIADATCAFLGGMAGVGVLAALYWFAIDPLPEHALLVRRGYQIERWYPAVASTICTDGRIYPPSNYRDPCRNFTPWVQP